MHTSRALIGLVAASLLAVGVAACGSDSADDASDTGSLSAETQRAIDQAIEGGFSDPPANSPHPKRGTNIWYVPLSTQIVDVNEAGSLRDAAEAMGWNLTICDGKFSSETTISCIRQAIADDADGIFTYVVDCIYVKSGLEQADAADIPVVGADGFDCNESKKGQPSLYDALVTYNNPSDPDVPLTYATWIGAVWGESQGLAIIDGTDGDAKLIDVFQSDTEFSQTQDDGVRNALDQYCPDCEIVETVEFTGADIGPPLQQKIAQALTQHPEANAILSPYDLILLTSVVPAVREAGRTGDIFVMGDEGKARTMDAIRNDDGVNAAVGLNLDWELWSGLDALNRLIAGERPIETPSHTFGFLSGNSTQIVTAEDNLPPPGDRYQPPIDFREAYLNAWGVSK